MKKKVAATVAAAINVLVVYWLDIGSTVQTGKLSEVFLLSSGGFILIGWFSVFFSEGLEAFKGPTFRGGYVDTPTPGSFFVFFGWFLLLIPVCSWIFLFFFV